MQTDIIIAGFGGQGVLTTGQLLAYAALAEKKEVTWIPSYGPEMRGGTANCTVVIADEEIGSPICKNPEAVIAFNQPSLEKYEPVLKSGGVLVVNQSMVEKKVTRKDLKVVYIDANAIAEKIGDKRMTNMVLLGGLLANLPVLPIKAIEKALEEHLPERHKKLLPLNYPALKEGASHKA